MNATRSPPSVMVVFPKVETENRWQQTLARALAGRAPRLAVQTFHGTGEALRDGPGHEALYAVGWEPPARFFDRVPQLRAFFSAAAGVDHLLRHPGLPPSVKVIRLEDAGMASQMAEYCCHEVFTLFRRYRDYEQQQHNGVWAELRTVRRGDFVIGVFGLGVLGTHVATTLAGFGYSVIGYSRSPHTLPGIDCYSGPEQFDTFLGRSRVLILLAPMTAQTENIIDARALKRLPAGAHVINVARGGLLDEEALLESLDSGHLASARLDVFRTEPLPVGHPFWFHPKIRLTPHVAAMTLLHQSVDQITDKIAALERGDEVTGCIDRERGY